MAIKAGFTITFVDEDDTEYIETESGEYVKVPNGKERTTTN